MDEAAADALVGKLIERGLIEEIAGEIGPTRRWSARVQAAAERINVDVERTGTYPQGNPLVLAVATALAVEEWPLDERDDAVRVLVTLELSRMSADKRARYGFDKL